MTRKEAYAVGNTIFQEVLEHYEQQMNGIFKKCNMYPEFKSFRGNIGIRSRLIDKIYTDHEAELTQAYIDGSNSHNEVVLGLIKRRMGARGTTHEQRCVLQEVYESIGGK